MELVAQIPEECYPALTRRDEPTMVDPAVVCISGDSQHSNKCFIPLRVPGTNIAFDALVDTGSQGCFIDKLFAHKQDFHLASKASPIFCVAFDGTPGVGGLVDHKWVGSACFGNSDLPLTLAASNLDKHQAILGFPWLDLVHAKITCGPNGRTLEFDGLSVAAVEVYKNRNAGFGESPPLSLPLCSRF